MTKKLSTPFAVNSTLRNDVPVNATNDQTSKGIVGYNNGWTSINKLPLENGGQPPYMEDINGVLFDITGNIVDINKGLPQYYDDAYATLIGGYSIGSRLVLNDNSTTVISTIANNQNNPNTNMTGWTTFANLEARFSADSIADLANISAKDGKLVYVKSYYSGKGIGGGYRVYTSSRSSENDGFLCVNGWVLLVYGNTAHAEQAGAVGDGKTDDITALQKVIDAKLKLLLSSSTYAISKALRVYDNTVITGISNNSTFISKTTNDVDSSQNVDAVILGDGTNSEYNPTLRNLNFSNFKMIRQGDSVIYKGYGFYSQGVCLSTFKNFDCAYSNNGIYIIDSWMNTWDRCTMSHGSPWYMQKGTSNTFLSCWATDTGWNTDSATVYAWDIGGEYHSLISCGADRVGLDGKPAEAVYNFTRGTTITCTSLASEVIHAKKLINISGMSITIGNLFTWQFFNKYGDSSNFGYFELSNASLTIENGNVGCVYPNTSDLPSGSKKPIFGTLRSNSVINIGSVQFDDKITGISDGSATMIDHDGTGSINIRGQTDYTMSSASSQKTVSSTFSGLNQSNLKNVHCDSSIALGSYKSANAPTMNFYSGGNANYVNSRFQAYGGDSATKGTLQVDANTFESVASLNYFSGNLSVVGAYNTTTANAPNLNIASDGTIARSTSSKRYKTDIQDIDTDVSSRVIYGSRPIRYRSLSDQDNSKNSYYGLIAEEVAEIDPRLVHWTQDENPVPDGVAYERFVPHLINVIKELKEEMEKIKNK